MKLMTVVGTRPNFVKAAAIHLELQQHTEIENIWVHTGQHHDYQMSTQFFDQLRLPPPTYFLDTPSTDATSQTDHIISKLEPLLASKKPNVLLVFGDVTSSLAASLAAFNTKTPIAHIEAGLRSRDLEMPEERNRIQIDTISDHLFVTEPQAVANLLSEGIDLSKIHFVGNTMIDTLIHFRYKIEKRTQKVILPTNWKQYLVATFHRPSNVDQPEDLKQVITLLQRVSVLIPIVFCVHPRTKQRLNLYDFEKDLLNNPNICLIEPLGYFEFLHLIQNSKLVLTDSGGIQEETTFLKVPCVTFRTTTERPVTVELGSNTLIPDLSIDQLENTIRSILVGTYKPSSIPEKWDGKAAKRIINILKKYYSN